MFKYHIELTENHLLENKAERSKENEEFQT